MKLAITSKFTAFLHFFNVSTSRVPNRGNLLFVLVHVRANPLRTILQRTRPPLGFPPTLPEKIAFIFYMCMFAWCHKNFAVNFTDALNAFYIGSSKQSLLVHIANEWSRVQIFLPVSVSRQIYWRWPVFSIFQRRLFVEYAPFTSRDCFQSVSNKVY